MSRARSEFSRAIKGQRYVFAKGHCERCGCDLKGKKAEYDHEIADGAGGKPTFENCRLLCEGCHRVKTSTVDVPLVAKVKRQSAVAAGVKTAPSKPIRSPGFARGSTKRTDNPMPALPPRALFVDRRP